MVKMIWVLSVLMLLLDLVSGAPNITSTPFETRWMVAANQQIILPLTNAVYDIVVDWGDNSMPESFQTPSPWHTYPNASNVSIKVWGVVDGVRGGSWGGLVQIASWGGFTVEYTSYGLFKLARNLLTISAADQPQIRGQNATMESMFEATPLNSPLRWNLTGVISLYNMFQNCYEFDSMLVFDTGTVQDMTNMFLNAAKYNKPTSFDTRSVTNMKGMFWGCSSFNSPVNFTDTSKVTNMGLMFAYSPFNQEVKFNTTSVVDMSLTFLGASSFNQEVNFDTTNVVDMHRMFQQASSFNARVSFSNTSKVVDFSNMFNGAISFNQNISFTLGIQAVNANNMFYGCTNLTSYVSMSMTPAACDNFCPYCLMPELTCGPCLNGQKQSSLVPWRACSCSLGEIDNGTVCVSNIPVFDACTGPAYAGPAGNCTCGVGHVGNVSYVFGAPYVEGSVRRRNGTAVGCTAIACPSPDYVGQPGQCSCAYRGSVSFVGDKTTGCEPILCLLPNFNQTASGVCVCVYSGTPAYVNGSSTGCVRSNESVAFHYIGEALAIQAPRNVEVFVAPDPVFGNSGVLETTTYDQTSRTVAMVVSIVFYDALGQEKNISNLSTPIRFWLPIRPGTTDPVGACLGKDPGVVTPLCSWYDPGSATWQTSGCVQSNSTKTAVECSCVHLTNFSLVFPNHNQLPPQQLIDIEASSISAKPGGLLVIVTLLVLFGIVLVFAVRRDREEKARDDLRKTKFEKWRKSLNTTPRLMHRFKDGMQSRHSWGALLWRKTGISFRSVDRAFVTLLLTFTLLTMSAMFHGRSQSYVGRAEVVVYSALAGMVPGFLLTYLFTHTGEMGFKERWFELRFLKPTSRGRFLRYRFPERCRWVWRVTILIFVIAMSWYILAVALMFDQNPNYYCQGETTVEWLIDVVIQYIITIVLIEPVKVFIFAILQGFAKPKPMTVIGDDLSFSDEPETREVKPPLELVTIPFDEIEITGPLGKGTFGKVDQCIWHGSDCAIKQLLNPKAQAEFDHEVAINRHLSPYKHQCVVGFIGLTQNPQGILLDLYPLRSVEDHVIIGENLLAPEDFGKVLLVLINASAGMLHLHLHGVVHRDIAARNFLIRPDLNTAVCDMGLALLLETGTQSGQRSLEERGGDMLPINTSAPETLARGEYSAKSDVFMFGIFIWELLARQTPHGDDPDLCGTDRNYGAFAARVRDGLQLKLPRNWPSALCDLMQKCWALDPAARPTMKSVNETLRAFHKVVLNEGIMLPPLSLRSELDGDGLYAPLGDMDMYSTPISQPAPLGTSKLAGSQFASFYQPMQAPDEQTAEGKVSERANSTSAALPRQSRASTTHDRSQRSQSQNGTYVAMEATAPSELAAQTAQ